MPVAILKLAMIACGAALIVLAFVAINYADTLPDHRQSVGLRCFAVAMFAAGLVILAKVIINTIGA